MKYSTSNVLTSLTLDLATQCRANGYDIFWQATGDTDAETLGLSAPKATITLVNEFPANPALIVRLKNDSAGSNEIVVPAMALQLPTYPRRVEILGLGHKDYWWERRILIDAFAADQFQQRDIGDLLHDWLQSEEFKELPINDFDSDAENPPALDNVLVQVASVESKLLQYQVEAVRFYTKATALVRYIE